ncbi:MAG: DUF5320 domain-containing protein [Candidatus Korarchaeota archaeon]|nr:DUF5320 domain-containing protein [Candidatus Korarchaeota archaeon]NIU84708.1 hypothetical protein [Candidatus Thorarchaeota archaeon]NIW14710.1 hypothetical protein [Candidatus Thorarchaeota archaeon]NIW52784.1 hypothetical protein [Candidatus Korarchaeota archaeon]
MAWRRGYRNFGRGFGGGGYGYWARATGMPGWLRASYGWPAYGGGWGRGNPYPYCRFFPWLPRWWWSGMYGPYQWTSQGPTLSSQIQPGMTGVPQPTAPWTSPFPTAPTQAVSNVETLRQQKEMLEQELKDIEARLKELEASK